MPNIIFFRKNWRQFQAHGYDILKALAGSPAGKRALIFLCVAWCGFAVLLMYSGIRFLRMIDSRLTGEIFQNTSYVFSAPRRISLGEEATIRGIAAYLRRAGYTDAEGIEALGRFRVSTSAIEVRPGPQSYFGGGSALRIEFSRGRIAAIRSLSQGAWVESAELEPEILTNLFDRAREKRRPVHFEELPRALVDAVLAAEDKRFFEHGGFDFVRILGAAWTNIRRGEKAQGASTITMQAARSVFFSTERTWRRKLAESLTALLLENRLTKQQIFELYANQVYLGNRGSFAVRGFGEAAQAFFGKDVRELNLSEAGFLAGILRAPNRYAAVERRAERAAEARDRVLARMVENKCIQPETALAAKKFPLRFVHGGVEAGWAPYFVDMVQDQVLEQFSESELSSRSHRIYTTLDPALQRAACEAVARGMRSVDAMLARRYALWRRRGEESPLAQVALVALNPQTGEVKALIGGREYGKSQLNRVLASRQPGSVFKPFVYATAFESAVRGEEPVLTPATVVVDEPTKFLFDGQEYTPDNYGQEYRGAVTLREALTQSLNVATVKVAEAVGYGRVAEVTRRLHLKAAVQPTPALALGSYEMTPMEVAGAYTIFPNHGVRSEPMVLRSVHNSDGTLIVRLEPEQSSALDPRVTYLVTSVLEDVVNRGTAANVRERGFGAPAGGKTGTSHDGWFAGFTSNLLCVVWVGFDDNRELGLSGAVAAAPIWADFMMRASALPPYKNPQLFEPPEGVTRALIDQETQQLATLGCSSSEEELFIAGTEPQESCIAHGGIWNKLNPGHWFSSLFGRDRHAPLESSEPPSVAEPSVESTPPTPAPAAEPAVQPPPADAPQKRPGFFRRLFGIRKNSEADPEKRSALFPLSFQLAFPKDALA